MRGYDASTYGEAFADVYDEWYSDLDEDVPAVVASLRALAERAGGDATTSPSIRAARILELAVGTGRLAIPLAAHGSDVHGIDSSTAMLERLRAKAGGERVTTHLGDMSRDAPDGPFDLIFIAYNSLFALDGPAQASCFHQVAERLSPSGLFAVEAFVPDRDRPAGATVGVRSLAADRVVLSVDVHHPDEQRAEGQFVEITETGGIRLRPWSIRYSSVEELDRFAADAGLSLLHRHETWSGRPFDEDSARHVSVYRKGPGRPEPSTGSGDQVA